MQRLADSTQTQAIVDTLAQWVRDRIASAQGDWAVIGIRSRGDVLAQRVNAALGPDVLGGRVGCLDITLYRDDLSEVATQPVVRTTEVDFDLDGLNVVLIDDVLMTGRSVRAALASLMDVGRPRRVWLAVLVDRGGRELPISPDFVGLDLTGDAPAGRVRVSLEPTDDEDAVVLDQDAGEAGEGEADQ